MTRAEYYQARAFHSSGPGSNHSSWQGQVFYERAGMPRDYLGQMRQMWESRAKGNDGFSMPRCRWAISDSSMATNLRIGSRVWEVVVGSGHSPEHACLHSKALDVMISGDQILPIITSNVSVHPTEPEANPLKDWMESHDKFMKTPGETLVLPAHNLPFYGVRERLRQLINHHEDRMLAIEEHCRTPALARDLLPVLFKRKLDPRQMMMALGEAIAHAASADAPQPHRAHARRRRPLPLPFDRSRSRPPLESRPAHGARRQPDAGLASLQTPDKKRRHWRHRLVIVAYRLVRWSQRRLAARRALAAGPAADGRRLVGFLPILGFWMFPLGVALVISDFPPLRRRLELWLNETRRRYHMDLHERRLAASSNEEDRR